MNHERGGGVVPYEAHNLEAPVQFGPPQHAFFALLKNGI